MYYHDMKKPIKKVTRLTNKKKFLVIAGLATAVLITTGAYFATLKLQYYDYAAKRAGLVEIRELIVMAIEDLKKDAPVEARTGDIYFPESRLYLPNPGTHHTFTYFYEPGDDAGSQPELSVSTSSVPGTNTLYSAQDVEKLFDAVPKLQSCSRGIKIVRQKFPQEDGQNELKHTVRLDNGQELYIYLEKDCPELADAAALFTYIKYY